MTYELAHGNKLYTNKDDDDKMSLSMRFALMLSHSGIRTKSIEEVSW